MSTIQPALIAPNAIPPADLQDLINRFARLYTGAVNDVLDRMGICNCVLPHGIVALRDGMRFAGRAMPVLGAPSLETDNDKLLLPWLEMLQSVRPGDVIVSQPNDNENAHFGELSSHAAKIAGCQGVVIDGGCRDIDYILHQSQLPVFCRYTTPKDIKGRWKLIDHHVPIKIGETTIHVGDFILADLDGIIAIPQELIIDVLEKAEETAGKENLTRDMILAGHPPLDAYLKHRVF
jgi:4-hydroxy-4-methyl-2-oxoglutarate aldolase